MIVVQSIIAHPRYRVRHERTRRLVRKVLQSEGIRNANISIVFTNDRRTIDLNSTYLSHHDTTDVISFELHDDGDAGIEGEVYVNLDQAWRQAKEYDVTVANERDRLIIHGVLHVLGYDDKTAKGRKEMRKLEEKYLSLTK